jgi:hypothetical protein
MRTGSAAVLGGLILLTACNGGGSDDAGAEFAGLSASAKVTAAKDAMRDLHSIHIAGTLSNEGQEVEVDLHMSADGRCAGTFAFSGGVAEVRAVDDGAWMRPDAAIWEDFSEGSADQVTDFVGDKWVVLDDPQLEQMCDFRSVMGSLSDSEPDRKYIADGTTEIDGVKTFRIMSSGSAGTTYGYVQADSPHYLTRTERREGEAPATMTFSDFDADVDVDVPDADDIIDLDQFSS